MNKSNPITRFPKKYNKFLLQNLISEKYWLSNS